MKFIGQYKYGFLAAAAFIPLYIYLQLWAWIGLWVLLSTLIITLSAYLVYRWARPDLAALRHRAFMKAAAVVAAMETLFLSYRPLDWRNEITSRAWGIRKIEALLLPPMMTLSVVVAGAIVAFHIYRFLLSKSPSFRLKAATISIVLMALVFGQSVYSAYQRVSYCSTSPFMRGMSGGHEPTQMERLFGFQSGC